MSIYTNCFVLLFCSEPRRTFTQGAREYVSRIEKKTILIDGAELARLCVETGVGVVDQSSFIVKKLDAEFFNEE